MIHMIGILLNFSAVLVAYAIKGQLNFINWPEKLILAFLIAILVEFAIRPIVCTLFDYCRKK